MTIELGIKNETNLSKTDINRIVTLMRLKTGLDIQFQLLRPTAQWDPEFSIELEEYVTTDMVLPRRVSTIQTLPDVGVQVGIDLSDVPKAINEVADLLAGRLFPHHMPGKDSEYTLWGDATIALTPNAVLNIGDEVFYREVTITGGTVNIAAGAVLEKVLFRFGVVNYPPNSINFVGVEGDDLIVNGVYYYKYTFSGITNSN